jgi:hypothetical protein
MRSAAQKSNGLKLRYLSLPRVTPMPLARVDALFEHPDWIFEPKTGWLSSGRL